MFKLKLCSNSYSNHNSINFSSNKTLLIMLIYLLNSNVKVHYTSIWFITLVLFLKSCSKNVDLPVKQLCKSALHKYMVHNSSSILRNCLKNVELPIEQVPSLLAQLFYGALGVDIPFPSHLKSINCENDN